MEITYTAASAPKWNDAEHTSLSLLVTFDHCGEVHFGCMAEGDTAHGMDIFARAVAGDFGPIAEYVAPTPTPAQIEKAYISAVQQMMDADAQAHGYDDIVSACSYAGYANAFQPEGLSFGQWRAAVWSYGYAEMSKIKTGARSLPTIEDFIAELPARVLP